MASKIKADMTAQEIMDLMSGGLPGVIILFCELIKRTPKIDPLINAGGFGVLVILDDADIRAERLAVLHHDVCRCNLAHLIALARALQLGLAGVTRDAIEQAIGKGYDSQPHDLDLPAILLAVKEALPGFNDQSACLAPPPKQSLWSRMRSWFRPKGVANPLADQAEQAA